MGDRRSRARAPGSTVRPARRGGGEADRARADGEKARRRSARTSPRRSRDPPRRDPDRGGSSRLPPPQGSEVVVLPHPAAAGRRRQPDRRGGGGRTPRVGPQGTARKRGRLRRWSVEAHVSGPFPFTLRVTDDGAACPRGGGARGSPAYDEQDRLRDDLERIGSFGPRRALPSIASVARVPSSRGARKRKAGRSWLWKAERSSPSARRELPGTTSPSRALRERPPPEVPEKRAHRDVAPGEVFHGVAIPGEGISFRSSIPGGVCVRSRESALDRAKRHAATTGNILSPSTSSPFFRSSGGGLPRFRARRRSLVLRQRRRFRDRGLYAASGRRTGDPPGDRLPSSTCSSPAAAGSRRQRPSGEDGGPLPVSRDLNELARHVVGGVLGRRRRARRSLPLPGGTIRREGQGRRDRRRTCRSRVSPFPLPSSGGRHGTRGGTAVRRAGHRGGRSGVLFILVPVGRCLVGTWSSRRRAGSSSSTSTPPTNGSSSRA